VAVASFNFFKLAPYIAAQLLGGFAGAVLVWLYFLPHWVGTQDPIGKLGCFCSYPAIPNRATNRISEIIPASLRVRREAR
jgi:glycerol uptake facilitator protein